MMCAEWRSCEVLINFLSSQKQIDVNFLDDSTGAPQCREFKLAVQERKGLCWRLYKIRGAVYRTWVFLKHTNWHNIGLLPTLYSHFGRVLLYFHHMVIVNVKLDISGFTIRDILYFKMADFIGRVDFQWQNWQCWHILVLHSVL